MGFKPMEVPILKKYISIVGWILEKGGIDWNLYTEKGDFVCSVKIVHGQGKKTEIAASSVRKIKHAFEQRGLKWPPEKKSNKN